MRAWPRIQYFHMDTSTHSTYQSLSARAQALVDTARSAKIALEDKGTFDEIVEFLRAANQAYYEDGNVLIDDATYDRLFAGVKASVDTHPGWDAGLTTQVAGGAVRGEVAHAVPMLSLDNVFSEDELRAWERRAAGLVGKDLGDIPICVEPKFDGVALSAHYKNGRLTQLVTRGDGVRGEDVSHAITMASLAGLPVSIPIDTYRALVVDGELEVRGELIMSDADFEAANKKRVASGKAAFANPRNATAGSLRSESRAYKLDMTFIGYDALIVDASGRRIDAFKSHTAAMKAVGKLGITTTATLILPDGRPALELAEDAYAAVERINSLRATMGFGTDGAVIKVDTKAQQAKAGAGSRAPRWAIAYKYPADMRLTTLEGIDVQIGRTGRLTPVARLAPVEVGGVTITSATLNNPDDIARKDLRIGDTVWVRRAGEVIPEVVGPELTKRPADATPWQGPDKCPRCGGDVDQTEAIWRCHNRDCGVRESIEYYASRKAMDIDGLGPKAVDQLVDAGLVHDVGDLYGLTADQVVGLDGFAQKSAEKLVEAIAQSKTQGLERVLTGLGIRFLGRRLSGRIAKAYPDMYALLTAVDTSGEAALNDIEGFGDIKTASIVEELQITRSLINKLAGYGVDMTSHAGSAPEPVTDSPLTEKRVLITGAVAGFTRDSVKAHAESLGATVASSVSKKLDMVIAGEKPGGSKITKAEALGVPVLSPREAGLID